MRVGNGRRTASGRRRVAGALIATVVTRSATAFLGAGGASAASPTATAQALVGNYIANYGHRAKPCHGLITLPWVSWLSYSDATISDRWRVYASSASLCQLADTQADGIIFDAPYVGRERGRR